MLVLCGRYFCSPKAVTAEGCVHVQVRAVHQAVPEQLVSQANVDGPALLDHLASLELAASLVNQEGLDFLVQQVIPAIQDPPDLLDQLDSLDFRDHLDRPAFLEQWDIVDNLEVLGHLELLAFVVHLDRLEYQVTVPSCFLYRYCWYYFDD